ncbi:hypothetical protein ABZ841_34005, partial [Streptomyces flaveolus]
THPRPAPTPVTPQRWARNPTPGPHPPRSPHTAGQRDNPAPRTAPPGAVGIRTDSPPPDWDTAATRPAPPVRAPPPVLW